MQEFGQLKIASARETIVEKKKVYYFHSSFDTKWRKSIPIGQRIWLSVREMYEICVQRDLKNVWYQKYGLDLKKFAGK